MSSSGVSAGPVREFLHRLKSAVHADLPMGLLDAADRIAVADEFEQIARAMYFRQVRVVQSLEESGAAAQVGATSVSALLQHRLRLSPAEANARVRAARALCESRSITGEVIPAPLPATAAASGSGDIGASHVDVIERTLHDLPDDLDPAVHDSVETSMVDYAKQFDPKILRRLGREIVLRTPKTPTRRRTPPAVDSPSTTIYPAWSRSTAAAPPTPPPQSKPPWIPWPHPRPKSTESKTSGPIRNG